MLVNAVILLNLLVAILSTTYEVVLEKSPVEYSSIIMGYSKFLRPSKHYNSLTVAPSPLNLIILPF
jgi:hypothetical protein